MINVRDFGALGNGTTDDTAAFIAAINHLQTNSAYRGGVLYIPSGVYVIKTSLIFTMYAPELVHNIILRGDGPQATVLDFSGAPAHSTGIEFEKGAHYGIEDLSIANTPGAGIVIQGGSIGSTDFTQQGRIVNVRITAPGTSGLILENVFMTRVEDVWVTNAGLYGFDFRGFSTSLSVSRCWSLSSADASWHVNGVVYSHFDACGADGGLYGYYITNVRGVVFNGCGAESNRRDAWLVKSSNESATNVLAAAQDVYGLALIGCYGFRNGLESPGVHANLVAAISGNSRPLEILVSACNTEKANTNDPSMSINGASGLIKITEESCKFDGPCATFNYVIYQGRRFPLVPTVVGASVPGSASYSIQSGSYVISDGILSYTMDLQWSGHSGSGGARVLGLPHKSTEVSPCHVIPYNHTFSGMVSGYVDAGMNQVTALDIPSGGSPSHLTLASSGRLNIAGAYKIQGFT